MDRVVVRWSAAIGAIAALLAGIASGAGVLLRGDLATIEVTTVRGELVPIVVDGIYRFNAEGIVAEGIGWDLVTLVVVVPLTLVVLVMLWRGSLRAALTATGLLAYLCYQSAQYAVYWAYGPLYPMYVSALAMGVMSLGLLVHGLDLARLPTRIGERFPHRAVVAASAAVIVILAGLWLPVIGGTVGDTTVVELQGASTLVVPAFDLGLLVPLAFATGITVHRRLAIGYVLGFVLLVKGATMALAIAAMLVVEYVVTGASLVGPLVLFLVVAAAFSAVAARAAGSLNGVEPLVGSSAPARETPAALAP